MGLDLDRLFGAPVSKFEKPVKPRRAELVAVPENPIPTDGKVGFITSRGGVALRYALWRGTSEHRFGTVCILTGRGEYIEKYSETISDLRRRGFTVATFDWRGQGGSDRELINPRKGHITDFTEYDDDLMSFVKQVLLPDCPAPFFALAHSMGANILLRNTAYESCQFERVVMVSPMLQLANLPVSEGVARVYVEAASLAGFSDAYVPGGSDVATEELGFEENNLTSDRVRFERFKKVLEAAPELGSGSPTNGWLHAAFRSMRELSASSFPGRIKVPVLILSAANDKIVSSEAIQNFATRARMCRLTDIPGARHEIMQERQTFREEFWAAFDKFIPGTKAWQIL